MLYINWVDKNSKSYILFIVNLISNFWKYVDKIHFLWYTNNRGAIWI